MASLLLWACVPDDTAKSSWPSFAAADGRWPGLFRDDDDTVWLSWIAPDGDGHALRYAHLAEGSWSAPGQAATGEDWFVNWADFPSLTAAGNTLVAHWLVKNADAPYAYDVALARSRDGGQSWRMLGSPHDDGTTTEHGFASVVLQPDGFEVVWLDGRNTRTAADHAGHGHGNGMTLRYARFDGRGVRVAGSELDDRVCDCCQTQAVRSDAGLVVLYRDRRGDEVRDVHRAMLVGSDWLPTSAVADDGWVIEGCPVNGPAAAAQGLTVVAAWFTAAQARPAVKAARSTDGGRSFMAPVTLAEGEGVVGRVDVDLVAGGDAIVSWVSASKAGPERGRLLARRLTPDGRAGPVATLAPVDPSRSGGFPRMLAVADRVVVAWQAADGVRAAAVSAETLPPPPSVSSSDP